MTTDLDVQLRTLIDDVEPIELSEVTSGHPATVGGRTRRIAALIAMAVVIASLAAVLALDRSTSRLDVTGSSSSTTIVDSGGAVQLPRKVTPMREVLPELPSDDVLLDMAAAAPPGDREWLSLRTWSIHSDIRFWPNARPVFSEDGTAVVGIDVPGAGLVSREVFEDPATDFEQLARDHLGAEEYERQLALIDEANAQLLAEHEYRSAHPDQVPDRPPWPRYPTSDEIGTINPRRDGQWLLVPASATDLARDDLVPPQVAWAVARAECCLSENHGHVPYIVLMRYTNDTYGLLTNSGLLPRYQNELVWAVVQPDKIDFFALARQLGFPDRELPPEIHIELTGPDRLEAEQRYENLPTYDCYITVNAVTAQVSGNTGC